MVIALTLTERTSGDLNTVSVVYLGMTWGLGVELTELHKGESVKSAAWPTRTCPDLANAQL